MSAAVLVTAKSRVLAAEPAQASTGPEVGRGRQPASELRASMAARQGDALLSRLVENLPAASRILQLGKLPAACVSAYRHRHPQADWCICEAPDGLLNEPGNAPLDPALSAAGISPPFDLIVIAPGLETLVRPAEWLRLAASLATLEASLYLHAGNAASLEELARYLEGDLSEEPADRLGPTRHQRLSPSSLYKLMMDAGWMPNLVHETVLDDAERGAAAVRALTPLADLWRVPIRTAWRRLRMERLVVQASLSFGAVIDRSPAFACFDVVVPVTRPQQLRLDVEASPGLREVAAQIVTVEAARDPAEAFAAGRQRCEREWILFCHQDVYFPAGFGHRLNTLLASIAEADRARTLIGFAGIGVNGAADGVEPAGFVIDRLNRFAHDPSRQALSLDELAIVVSRETLHQIDPTLGWHLWATDLCLTSICQHRVFPRIVTLPLFHNSLNDFVLPEAFHRSAAALAAKHADFGPIHTLCGTIGEGAGGKRG